MADKDTQLFSKHHLPARHLFSDYRKRTLTSAVYIAGHFVVDTTEGMMECRDGWLAIDSAGNPYPIAANVFAQTYEPV